MDEQSPPAELGRDDSDAAGALERVRQRMLAAANQEVTVAGDEGDSGEPTPPQVGRYVVLDTLGAGGMGVVVRAYDPSLQREVALKRVLDAGRRGRARLLREAQAMARLHHPNVVSVFDVQARDEDIVIAMELVAGGDLRGWLCEKPAPEEIVARFLDAGRGLAAAHAVGLVHRDFKPANVLLDLDGTAKVGDFGLAKDHDTKPRSSGDSPLALEADALQTAAGVVMGTPRYMAPEQANGQGADARSDQYAFCVALWEALCGKPPFDGEDTTALQWSKMKGAPRWTGVRGVSARQAEALTRGLNVDPTQRFEDMESLLEALRPRTFGRSARAVTGALMLAAAVGYASWPTDDACVREREARVEAWKTEQRPAVLEHLEQIDLPFMDVVVERATSNLDAFMTSWVEAHGEVCGPDSLHDPEKAAALTCLAVRRSRWQSTVDGLLAVDEQTAHKTHGLLARVQRPEQCLDADVLLAAGLTQMSPEQRESRAAFQEKLDRARVASFLDQPERATVLLDEATELAGEDVKAQLEVRDTRTYSMTLGLEYGDLAEALEQLYRDALRAGENGIAVRAGSRLGALLVVATDEVERGTEIGRTTLAMAVGEDVDVNLLAAAYGNLGNALVHNGVVEEGAELIARSVELRVEAGETSNFDHALALGTLARARDRQGRHDEALRAALDAHTVLDETYGPSHPWALALQSDSALLLGLHGRVDEAEALLRASLASAEQNYGSNSPRTLPSLDNLATLLVRKGEFEEADRLFRRSLALKESSPDKAFSRLQLTKTSLARLHVFRGSAADALPLIDADSSLVIDRLTLGEALLALGRLDEARGHADAGLEIAEETLGPSAEERVALGVLRARIALGSGDAADAQSRASQLWETVSNPPAPAVLRAQVAALSVEVLGDRALAGTIRAAGRKACLDIGFPNPDCKALVGDTPAVLVGDEAQ